MSKKKEIQPMQVAGRLELIDLIDFNIYGIDAKIDTGAYSSSLHCDKIEVRDRELHISFKKLTKRGQPSELVFKDFTVTRVKSSNGIIQNRYKIKTTIRLGDRQFITDFTLADRGSMKYPVLLGRKAIKRLFLVDVSKKYLISK